METHFAARLSEPFLLALLEKGGPAHGYALLQQLQEAFGEEAFPKPRVYQILRRFEEEGLVEAQGGKGKQKPYAITDAGQQALAQLRAQSPAFFNQLSVLLPDMEVGVASQMARAEELPRDGARTQTACPGCQSLRVQMERTLPADELTIKIARQGESQMHAEGCVIGLALRRLASSLLP